MSAPTNVELRFRSGTLEISGLGVGSALPSSCAWDERTACHRAPACAYADVVRALRRQKIEYADQARRYETLSAGAVIRREPRPYQHEALAAWDAGGSRGVVVLPTGAGKTLVAHMAMDLRRRSTLVVTPTLDLVRQWYEGLRTTFGIPVGIVGGGDYDVQPLTVTTYDSAYLHMEHLGDRFGFLVFDECHHLPATSYSLAARFSLAPFRMGLTATPERDDWNTRGGQESEGSEALAELIGPIVYRKDIVAMSGEYLSSYETVRVAVDLSPAERAEYAAERALYRQFLDDQGISMAGPHGLDRVHHPQLAQRRGPPRLCRLPPTKRDRLHRAGQAGLRGNGCCTSTATIAPSSSPRTTPPCTWLRAGSSCPPSPIKPA